MGIENPGGEDEVAGLIDLGKYVKSHFLGFFKRGMIGVLVLDRFRLVKVVFVILEFIGGMFKDI